MNINLSKLTGKLLEIAKLADTTAIGENSKNNKYLDSNEEISLFLKDTKIALDNEELEVDDIKALFGYNSSTNNQEFSTDLPKGIKQADINEQLRGNLGKFDQIEDTNLRESIIDVINDKIQDATEIAKDDFENDTTNLQALITASSQEQKKTITENLINDAREETKTLIKSKLDEIFMEAMKKGDMETMDLFHNEGYKYDENKDSNMLVLYKMPQEVLTNAKSKRGLCYR